jgi:hypothetical protein
MNLRTGIVLSVVVWDLLACRGLSPPSVPTVAPTSSLNPALRHFEDQWVAFDYPEGLDVFESLDPTFKWCLQDEVHVGGEQVVGLGDARARANGVYLRSIQITHQGLSAGQDVQHGMQELYQSFDAQYNTAGPLLALPQAIVVDGAPAFQKSYRVFWGEPAYDFRDVWIPHGDALYVVSVLARWSNLEALARFNADADVVLRSLVIK